MLTAPPDRTEAAEYTSPTSTRFRPATSVRRSSRRPPRPWPFRRPFRRHRSLHRYAPDKWSIRQVLSHLNDTERVFSFRALWFARGFDEPLPGFDQTVAVTGAAADAARGPATSTSFATSAPRRWHCSGLCRPRPGRDGGSGAEAVHRPRPGVHHRRRRESSPADSAGAIYVVTSRSVVSRQCSNCQLTDCQLLLGRGSHRCRPSGTRLS